jgi:TP901 family phage tail tape measure protein
MNEQVVFQFIADISQYTRAYDQLQKMEQGRADLMARIAQKQQAFDERAFEAAEKLARKEAKVREQGNKRAARLAEQAQLRVANPQQRAMLEHAASLREIYNLKDQGALSESHANARIAQLSTLHNERMSRLQAAADEKKLAAQKKVNDRKLSTERKLNNLVQKEQRRVSTPQQRAMFDHSAAVREVNALRSQGAIDEPTAQRRIAQLREAMATRMANIQRAADEKKAKADQRAADRKVASERKALGTVESIQRKAADARGKILLEGKQAERTIAQDKNLGFMDRQARLTEARAATQQRLVNLQGKETAAIDRAAKRDAMRFDDMKKFEATKARLGQLRQAGYISPEAEARAIQRAWAKTEQGKAEARAAKPAKAPTAAGAPPVKPPSGFDNLMGGFFGGKGIVTRGIAGTFGFLQTRMMNFAGGFADFGGSLMTTLGRLRYAISSLRTVFDPLINTFSKAVKGAADFDEAITRSAAVMQMDDQDRIDKMSKSAIDASLSLRQGATELARTYYQLGSAGYSAETSIKVLPTVAKFATVAIMDTAEATKLLSQTQRAMGLDGKTAAEEMNNLTHVANVLTKAETLAQGTLKELTTTLAHDAGAAARNAGISLEQVAAAAAALSNRGMTAANAGNMIGRMIRLLGSAAANNKDVFKEVFKTDESIVFDEKGVMRQLPEIFKALEKGMAEYTPEAQVKVFESLGFRVLSQKAIAQFLGAGDTVQEFTDKLNDSADALKDMHARHMKAFNAQLDVMRNNLMAASIETGNTLLPFLREVMTAVTEGAKAFRALEPSIKQTIIIIGVLTSTLTGLFVTFTVVGAALSFLFGPAGIILTGVALVSAAFSVWVAKVVRENGGIVKALAKVSDWLKDVYKRTALLRYVFIDVMGKALVAVENFVDRSINRFAEWARNFTGSTFDSVENFQQAMTQVIIFTEWATKNSERMWELVSIGAAYATVKAINEIKKALGGMELSVSASILRLSNIIVQGFLVPTYMLGGILKAMFRMMLDGWKLVGELIQLSWEGLMSGEGLDHDKVDAKIKKLFKNLGNIVEEEMTQAFAPLAKSFDIGLGKNLDDTEEKLKQRLRNTFEGVSKPSIEQLNKEYDKMSEEFKKREAADYGLAPTRQGMFQNLLPKEEKLERKPRVLEGRQEYIKRKMEEAEGFTDFYNKRIKEINGKLEMDKFWEDYDRANEEAMRDFEDPFEKPKNEFKAGSEDYMKTMKEQMKKLDAVAYDSLEAQVRIDEYLDRIRDNKPTSIGDARIQIYKGEQFTNSQSAGRRNVHGKVAPNPTNFSRATSQLQPINQELFAESNIEPVRIDEAARQDTQIVHILDEIRRIDSDQLTELKRMMRRESKPGSLFS